MAPRMVRSPAPPRGDLRREDLEPVEVRDPLDRFSLLASAVAGYALDVRLTDRPLAYTDGESVYIPGGMADPDIALAVVVQSALLGAGSLDRRVVSHLTARGTLARRYLTCEARRAVGEREGIVPARIVEIVAAHWSGRPSATPTESLARAQTREEIPAAPEAFGTIRGRALRTTGAAPGHAPGKLDRQGKTQFIDTPEMDDEEDSESINFMRALSTPMNVFGDNPLMKWMKATLGVGTRESPDGGGGGGEEMPAGGAVWGDQAGESAKAVMAVVGVHQRAPDGPPGHLRYPEWDYLAGGYRPGFCHVRELEPASGGEPVRPVTDLVLRRALSRLGLDYERHRHEIDGPDLCLTSVVDFTVARARGEAVDARIYQTRRKTARDLAVLVLLDASGSTSDQRQGRGTIFDDERQVVSDLVDALDLLGDRVGAFAFNSRGPGLIRFLRIKEFDGRFDDAAIGRLSGLKPNGFTRLGAAIRHATHLLTTKGGAANSLLVVISDGFPYDDGYEGPYGEADTRQALDEAVSNGVGCLCVSLGAVKGDDALADLWGAASHIRLAHPSELGLAIGPLLETALEVAARRGGEQPRRQRASKDPDAKATAQTSPR